jgi:hypothetical protein
MHRENQISVSPKVCDERSVNEQAAYMMSYQHSSSVSKRSGGEASDERLGRWSIYGAERVVEDGCVRRRT